MKRFLCLIAFFFTLVIYSQIPVLIKDSIMNNYMENGFATKNFQPKGKTDSDSLRQGFWEDYKVEKDYEIIAIDGKPKHVMGVYLIYGEGNYTNNIRTGKWKFFVIEDKSLKKILQQEASYKDGYRDGSFTYYFPTGAKAITGTYSIDAVNGECKNFYENGAVFALRNYAMGLANGKQYFYFPNGSVQIENDVKDGKSNGVYKLFYANGKLMENIVYKMGVEDGMYQYYYDNGQLWIEKEYKMGRLLNVTASFAKNGKKKDKGSLNNGNGTVNYYTEDGKIYNTITYKDGIIINETDVIPEPDFRKQ